MNCKTSRARGLAHATTATGGSSVGPRDCEPLVLGLQLAGPLVPADLIFSPRSLLRFQGPPQLGDLLTKRVLGRALSTRLGFFEGALEVVDLRLLLGHRHLALLQCGRDRAQVASLALGDLLSAPGKGVIGKAVLQDIDRPLGGR